MVKKKPAAQLPCLPMHREKGAFCIGIAFLIVAALLYFGLGWKEIFGVLGILAILKGLFMRLK